MLSSSTFNISFEKLISLITPNLEKIVSSLSVTLKNEDLPKVPQNNVNDVSTPLILNISDKLDISLSNLESTLQSLVSTTSCLATKDEFTSLIQTNIIGIVSPLISSTFETSKVSFDTIFSLLSLESPLFTNQFKITDFNIFSQSIFNYLATNFAIIKESQISISDFTNLLTNSFFNPLVDFISSSDNVNSSLISNKLNNFNDSFSSKLDSLFSKMTSNISDVKDMIATLGLSQKTSLSALNNCFIEWSYSLTIQTIFDSLLPKFSSLSKEVSILQSFLTQFAKTFSLLENIINYLPSSFADLSSHITSLSII
jgi:hypothetical protein